MRQERIEKVIEELEHYVNNPKVQYLSRITASDAAKILREVFGTQETMNKYFEVDVKTRRPAVDEEEL